VTKLDLRFLGSGNAFAAQGRAFSSFLLNDRYLFDCGPTVLQQLAKAGVSSNDIETVFISHYHADHFFGLPFLLLDAKYGGRTKDLTIVGPPGIEARTCSLLELGYPGVIDSVEYERHYVELRDGFCDHVGELSLTAARVKHVDEFDCFAIRAEIDGRCLVYSGDTTLCDGLLRLVSGAEVIVTECSCNDVPVHLGPSGIEEVARHAPGAKIVVTHLDGLKHPTDFDGLIVAEDLALYSF
jgi:ribonuclease BN (tRNA processing enzyme)